MFGEKIHDHQKAIEVYRPPYAISMNWASPRSVLIKAGLFNEAFQRCQDVDLSMQIDQLGYKLVYQPDSITYHRNEHSLPGLFREGFQHGLWGVKCIREHRAIIQERGHKRVNLQSYRIIGGNLLKVITGQQRMTALCQATFDIGKKAGKFAGAFRFRYIDL